MYTSVKLLLLTACGVEFHKKKKIKVDGYTFSHFYKEKGGATVAQWVMRWPTDFKLAVPRSSLARGEIFSTVKMGLHCTQPLIITRPSS